MSKRNDFINKLDLKCDGPYVPVWKQGWTLVSLSNLFWATHFLSELLTRSILKVPDTAKSLLQIYMAGHVTMRAWKRGLNLKSHMTVFSIGGH